MSLAVVAVALAGLIVLVAWGKVHPFLAFLTVSVAAALALGIPPAEIPAAIRKGIGDILGALTIIIVCGAMLGRLVVDSGAAQRIAEVLVGCFGAHRISWAMALTGFIVGIPLFYGVGFVLMVPIIFAVVARYAVPPLVVAVPALAAMSVAHGLLPPHPAPTALVAAFDASLGRTLLLGFMISVPALVIAGPVFARSLTRIQARPPAGLVAKEVPAERLPSGVVSIVVALLPAVLLLVTTVLQPLVAAESPGAGILRFVSDPDVVMLVALVVAALGLGIARGRRLPDVMETFTAAIGDVASILLIIAGSGAFKEVLVKSGVNASIASALEPLAIDPLLLGWLVTAAIRICVGSATVAGLTAAGILAPLVEAGGIDPDLMVLAIGSGSLVCSHVNDGAFWLFKEYFNVSLVETLRSWTVMETIVSLVGLAGVLLLARML